MSTYTLHGGVKVTIRDGDWIKKHFEAGGYYEPIMLDHIKTLGKGLVFLDAGAFVGSHSLYFATECRAKAVYAYEPCAEAFGYLTSNIAQNNAGHVVSAFNVALGDRTGSGSMIDIDAENLGMAQFVYGPGDVPATTIDDEVQRLSLTRLDVVKIDVEGMGLDVLAGSRRTIQTLRPRMFVECETQEAKNAVNLFMLKMGYKKIGKFNSTPTLEYAHV